MPRILPGYISALMRRSNVNNLCTHYNKEGHMKLIRIDLTVIALLISHCVSQAGETEQT